MRAPDVDKIISKIKVKRETGLRGIVAPNEVRRLCAVIRKALAGNTITKQQRARLLEFTTLQRCFTVAEADIISDMSTKRVRPEKAQECTL